MRLFRHLLIATALGTFGSPLSISGALASADAQPNRIRIEYVPPSNPEHQGLYAAVKERRVLEKLQEIPGVSQRVAEIVIAEIGVDMGHFPNDQHLASWAGMCPGNHESAGKRLSGKRRKGSTWLRAALTEAGWAASHSRNTYLAAQYHQIRRRRGSRRACIAVGHSILVMAYHLLSDPNARFEDLGPDYFEKHNKVRLANQLVCRLQKLGFKITIEVPAA